MFAHVFESPRTIVTRFRASPNTTRYGMLSVILNTTNFPSIATEDSLIIVGASRALPATHFPNSTSSERGQIHTSDNLLCLKHPRQFKLPGKGWQINSNASLLQSFYQPSLDYSAKYWPSLFASNSEGSMNRYKTVHWCVLRERYTRCNITACGRYRASRHAESGTWIGPAQLRRNTWCPGKLASGSKYPFDSRFGTGIVS